MTGMSRNRISFLASLSEFAVRLEERDAASASKLRILVRDEAVHEGAISQRRAAQILDVSDETVASWLEAGVLETAHTPTSDLPRVEPASLLGVKERLDDLRGQGLSRRAMVSLLRGSPRIGGPEDRPWAKQRTDITDRELANLRAGKVRR